MGSLVTMLLEFAEVEQLLLAYLSPVFWKLRVSQYVSDEEAFRLEAGERAAVFVLCQGMRHPAPPQLYFAEGFGQVLTADQPSVKVNFIVSMRDVAEKKDVSEFLKSLRLIMAGFTLPVPEGMQGAWICIPTEEEFLGEAEGVFTYGALYGLHFRPPQAAERKASGV